MKTSLGKRKRDSDSDPEISVEYDKSLNVPEVMEMLKKFNIKRRKLNVLNEGHKITLTLSGKATSEVFDAAKMMLQKYKNTKKTKN